jgi:hypothetical protein
MAESCLSAQRLRSTLSMAPLAGFVAAYPMNWWLVAKGLKHGMMTVRRPAAAHSTHEPSDATHQSVRAVSDIGHAGHANVSRIEIIWMSISSVAVFALGIGAAELLSGLGGM